MSFYELKEIPITDLLTHLGHRPVSRAKGGRQWFYHSPLREDNNASFCVSSDKNLPSPCGILGQQRSFASGHGDGEYPGPSLD